MKQHNPELFSLSLCDWQLFCTFTFKQAMLAERVRLAMFFALARTLAGNSGLHFKRLMWVLRKEHGEATGRFHFHALFAGLPPHWKNWVTCNSTEKLWVKFGGGHAVVSEYNPTLDGVDYILKRGDELVLSLAKRWAGDYYELTKFGERSDLMLSESLFDHLFQRSLVGKWGRGGERKDKQGLQSSNMTSGVREITVMQEAKSTLPSDACELGNLEFLHGKHDGKLSSVDA